MSAKLVSPESVSSAPITNPKNLGEYEQMLRINSTNISQADYDAIYARLNVQKYLLSDYASKGDGLLKHMTQMYIKELMAALQSAMNLEKARKVKEKTDLIQAPAIAAAQNGDKKAVTALQVVTEAMKPINVQKSADTAKITTETKIEVAKVNKDVVKTSLENTLKQQAEGVIQYIEIISPKLKDSKILADMRSNLSDTNLRSLIDHLANGRPYVSDGAFGIFGERWMVGRMEEEYKINKDFSESIQRVQPILRSGVNANLATRDFKIKDKIQNTPDSLIAYLGNLYTNAGDKVDGTGSATAMSGDLIVKTLKRVNQRGELLKYLNQAINLSGSQQRFANQNDLVTALKKDESLKYSIIDGMNMLWSMQELPGLKEGVLPEEKELLQKIDTKLKEAVNVSRAAALKGATTPEQKKAVELAYADLANQVSRSDVQYSFGLALTNKGSGVGAGLQKWLDDKNSLTVNAGLAGGKPVFEFGIRHEFMRTENSQLSGRAGIMTAPGFVLPFVEGIYTNEQWTTTLKLTAIGGMATVSKELGNSGVVSNWMESFKQKSPELADQLLRFSDTKTKANEVNFTRDISNIASKDQPSYAAVSRDMNEMIQKILTMKGFDTMTDPHERYALLVTTITNVVKERQYRIQRDAATNGVSATDAGIALGVFNSVPFVLPFVSFGGNKLAHQDIQKTVTHSKTEKLTSEDLQSKYLTKAPELIKNTDGTFVSVIYSFNSKVINLSQDTVKIIDGSRVSFDANTNTVTFAAPPKISIKNGILELSTVGEFSKASVSNSRKELGVEQVRDILEARNKISPKLSQDLYFIGHNSNQEFKDIIRKLSRQDFDGAKNLVEQLQKKGKYKSLATSMLNAWGNVPSFLTHMYGSNASRAKQEFTQTYVDISVRTSETIRAEQRLARQSGIMHTSNETDLRIAKGERYTASTTAAMFPGQEMTISCFSTPDPGLHRIDTYDASVSISNKKVEITDSAYKTEIVNATLANVSPDSKGIRGQWKKLNLFLDPTGKKETVTLDQYMKYLINGDPQILGVPGLTVSKVPTFFEGRALIAGNVCMNRLHGIIYPTFVWNGITQGIIPPPQIDATETVSFSETTIIGGITENTAVKGALGIGGVGDSGTGGGVNNGSKSTPTTVPKGGAPIDGPMPTPGLVTPGTTTVPLPSTLTPATPTPATPNPIGG